MQNKQNLIVVEQNSEDTQNDQPNLETTFLDLKSKIPIEGIRSDLKDESVPAYDKAALINSANNVVLIEYLSPEIKENERTKRTHKTVLIILMTLFLVIQFIAVALMSNKILTYSISVAANIEIVKCLLTFMSAYITSVVVELIAILNIIVKNVFDTSLAALVKVFRDKTKQKD